MTARAYLYLLTAISMSLGWRIRGQFGHEIGAAMAGALAGLAIVMAAGRDDWRRRAVSFAALGAIGWSFGGSMSYMKVVGFCHSSDPATVLYAFGCMVVIGFLWGAPGGAAVAMAATLDARRLSSVLLAMAAVFAVWFAQDIVVDVLKSLGFDTGWHGSDWLGASAAIVAALFVAAVRRQIGAGVSLMLYLALGWWIAFAGLVLLGGLHMNPPRGDNWAGCIGIVGGLLVYCRRQQLPDVLRAALVTGFVGGVGFALGQLLKLAILRAQWTDNPHVVMEWTHGACFGVALAAAMLPPVRGAARLPDEPIAPAAQFSALFWLLWILPYYNVRKCAEQWGKQMPVLADVFQGLPLTGNLVPSNGWVGWIDVVFLAWAIALVALLVRQRRAPSPLIPADPHGRAQLLYIILVWIFAVASFSRDVTNFGSGNELRIQVVITLHAVLCTVLALWPEKPLRTEPSVAVAGGGSIGRVVLAGLLAGAVASALCFAGKEAMFRRTFAPGFYMDHIRFGPNNTNDRK